MQQTETKPGDYRLRLPVGTVLNDVYVIDGELGAGGFGITYRGHHKTLGRIVAIKEYFPAQIGDRDSTNSVHPVSGRQDQVFQWGRTGFVNEARMLAGIKHPNIVQVFEFFEAHNTAYMVLQFEQGQSFGKWLDKLGRMPTQAELDRIVEPLCDALATIHEQRLVHRDIAPDNIIIRTDGTPVLLDFGAARYEVAEHSRLQEHSVHTTSYAVIKAHYSPIEQRSTDIRNRGPWSDIYALGATLYKAVTSQLPKEANDRLHADTDPLQPASTAARGEYRHNFLDGIDRAMALRRQDRPQSIAAFKAIAFSQPGINAPSSQDNQAPERRTPQQQSKPAASFDQVRDHRPATLDAQTSRTPRMATAAALIAVIIGSSVWLTRPASPPKVDVEAKAAAELATIQALRAKAEADAERNRNAAELAAAQAATAKAETEAAWARAEAARSAETARREREIAERQRAELERSRTEAAKRPTAPPPSFDCANKRQPDEVAICDNPDLASLDRRLATLYGDRTAGLAGEALVSLRSAQVKWLENRKGCGGGVACIRAAYNQRISDLEAKAPSTPPSAKDVRSVLSGVSDGVLNLRIAPNTNSTLLIEIPAGAGGVVVDHCQSQTPPGSRFPWCKVTWRGRSGWVSSGGLTK